MSNDKDIEMTFWEHVEALRPCLWRSVVAILVAAVAAFCCKGFIIDQVLFGPMRATFPTNELLMAASEWISRLCEWINGWLHTSLSVDPDAMTMRLDNFEIINTTLAGQFNTHMKISLAAGLVISMPIVVWQLWLFVRPALTPSEHKAAVGMVGWISAGFVLGVLFGYFVIAPLSVNFFANYTASHTITNLIDVGNYFGMVVTSSVLCGLLFELPLVIRFLARVGLITANGLRRYRRHAFVVLLVVSAIFTPPDIFSMIVVVIPVYALYELSIVMAAKVERKKVRTGNQ